RIRLKSMSSFNRQSCRADRHEPFYLLQTECSRSPASHIYCFKVFMLQTFKLHNQRIYIVINRLVFNEHFCEITVSTYPVTKWDMDIQTFHINTSQQN